MPGPDDCRAPAEGPGMRPALETAQTEASATRGVIGGFDGIARIADATGVPMEPV